LAINGHVENWDKEVDVIVVGYGAAGGISAITAHDAGAKVLLIEKMPHPGGISILSGGGVAFAHDAEGAFQYLKRTCNGTTPDDILRKMAEEMVRMLDWVTELAKVSGTEPTKTETRGHGTYPFPGTHEIDSIKLKDFPAYSEFPWAKGLRGGARLFKVVCDNVKARLNDEFKRRGLPGKPFVTARVTQLYRTGVCVYFYFGFYYKGLSNPQEVYLELENIARDEILKSGGSLSHHHGVGKLRRAFLGRIMSQTALQWKRDLKKTLDPMNVFGAGNQGLDIR